MGNLQIGKQFKVKNASSPGLSLRKEATTMATTKDGKEKNLILSIPNGTKLTLQSDKVETSDKHTWYNVKYTDKDKKELKGWVASDYLEEPLPLPPLPPLSLPTLSWSALWDNLPSFNQYPCREDGYLFSVGSERVGELNLTLKKVEKVSDSLRELFEKHSITLGSSASATVTDTSSNREKWTILDANKRRFLILREDRTENQTEKKMLNVYEPAFDNQCAIRMGVALEKTKVDLSSFQGVRCWQKHDNNTKHILRAQELADWLTKQTKLVGKVQIIRRSDPWYDFKGKRGIVFFQNITGHHGIDHIDVLTSTGAAKNQCDKLKNVPSTEWLEKCQQVWFWNLCPYTIKAEAEEVTVYLGADSTSEGILSLPPNELLDVRAVQGNWVKVMVEDPNKSGSRIEGWIERRFVSGIPDQAVVA